MEIAYEWYDDVLRRLFDVCFAEAEEEEGAGEQEEEASAEEGAQEGPRGSRTHPRHLSGQ